MSRQRLVTTKTEGSTRNGGPSRTRAEPVTESEAALLRKARSAFQQAALREGHRDFHPDASRFLRSPVGEPDVAPPVPATDEGATNGSNGASAPDTERDELLEWLWLEATLLADPDRSTNGRNGSADPTASFDAATRDVLLDSLAELAEPVGVFVWPGGSARWANRALASRAPVADGEPWTFMKLLDEWSQAHFLVRALPVLVRDGRWRGGLFFVDEDGTVVPMAATVIAHQRGGNDVDSFTLLAHEDPTLSIENREERAEGADGTARVAAPALVGGPLNAPLNALMKHISDLLLVMDSSAALTYVSPAATELLKITVGDDGQPTGRLLDVVHPDDRPLHVRDLLGKPRRMRFLSADGSWLNLETVVTDLLDNPAVDGYVLTARDTADDDGPRVVSADAARRSRRRRTFDSQLREALANDGLLIRYQPIFATATDDIVGAEALLRVRGEAGELLNPAAFVDAAESTGLITELGAEVLRITSRQLGASGLDVSVNVSPRQISAPGFAEVVVDILADSELAPDQLWIEITEGAILSQGDQTEANILALRERGVRVGLDEMGSGRTSIGALRRFPLDFVKLDRNLVAGIGANYVDGAIVRSTIELSHQLGLVVSAVGVESDAQHDALHQLGCDRVQGHLFAGALEIHQLLARLQLDR